MRWRRAGAAAGVAGGVAVLAVALNWLVVREAAETAGAEAGVVTGKTRCPKADGSSPPVRRFAQPPPRCIQAGKRYTAEVRTDAGVVVIGLEAAAAPATVNNFVVLARYHFYDGTPLAHGPTVRAVAAHPGYVIADERPGGGYEPGSVAMLSTGPGTSASEFFVVMSERVNLAPIYARFGQVTAGLEALRSASRIESVTIREA